MRSLTTKKRCDYGAATIKTTIDYRLTTINCRSGKKFPAGGVLFDGKIFKNYVIQAAGIILFTLYTGGVLGQCVRVSLYNVNRIVYQHKKDKILLKKY